MRRLLCVLSCAVSAVAQQQFVIQTVAGSDFVGDGGPALAAAFSQAEGITLDRVGNIYVSDANDHRIRKITPDGVIQTIAGNGRPGFGGDGGPATASQLNQPYGLAIDSRDNLYVADLGNGRVRKLTVDGLIYTIAGGGSHLVGGDGEGGPATVVRLKAPRNVVVDRSGIVYISDFAGHQVCRVDANGTLTTVAGNGTQGGLGDGGSAALAQLSYPAGLAVDPSGILFIADSGNRRVRRVSQGAIQSINLATLLFSPTGLSLDGAGNLFIAGGQLLKLTAAGALSSSGPAAHDVVVDGRGDILYTTGNAVRRSTAGVTTVVAGMGRYGFAGDGGAADRARLNRPTAIAFDSAGNAYIADRGNNRIRRMTPAGTITTIAGTGERGFSGDGGLALSAQLDSPDGLAIDADGNIFVADSGNSRVRRISSGLITTVAGTGVRGTAFDGALATQSPLDSPTALLIDTARNLYIADTGGNRVYRVDRFSRISAVALGDRPRALALDAAGTLYIADSSRVLRIADNAVSTVASGLRSPAGLAINGSVFIAESGAHQVRRLNPDGSLSTIAGTGLPGFSGDSGSATGAQLDTPSGLAVDSAGNIWVADSGNHRVRRLTFFSVAPPEAIQAIRLVHAATFNEGSIAPGQIVTILGAPSDAQVFFDDMAATVLRASTDRVDVLVPAELAGRQSVTVEIRHFAQVIQRSTVALAASAIGIFTIDGGTGLVAALNEDGSPNSATQSSLRGSVVSLYATGEGSGLPLSVQIGGLDAEVLFAGPATGYSGLLQINARVPVGFFAAGPLPVVVKAGDSISQPGVFIWVK
jgi:uncharacterized protein (TIGR03437 family)